MVFTSSIWRSGSILMGKEASLETSEEARGTSSPSSNGLEGNFSDSGTTEDGLRRGPSRTSSLPEADAPIGRLKSEVVRRQSQFALGRKQVTNIAQEQAVGKPTLVDAAAMKDKVRQALTRKKYDVTDFYKTSGLWPAIAKDGNFEKLTLSVIFANALWIAVDTDLNTAAVLTQAHPVFQVAENFFCAFFGFEWLSRFMSFRRKRDCCRDRWFVFDGIMCIQMAMETWVLSVFILVFVGEGPANLGGGNTNILRIARLMRLSRVFRMAKLVRAIPEVFVMLKGLFAAARSVFFTLLLLGFLIFVFGIAFKQLAMDTELGRDTFSSVPQTCYFLMVHGTLRGPAGMLSTDIKAQQIWDSGSMWLCLLFLFFVLVSSVLVVNMLIGVLCAVVSAVSSTEKEELMVNYVGSKLNHVMTLIDEDGGGTISRDEFLLILENGEAIEALQDVGVDVIGLVDFADFIFGQECEEEDEVELTMPEFMDVVFSLRGSNNATVKDIVDLRKFFHTSLRVTSNLTATAETVSIGVCDLITHSQALLDEVAGIFADSDRCKANDFTFSDVACEEVKLEEAEGLDRVLPLFPPCE
eukprot:TRINITY_DN9967_c2_g1_i1.p1 TRINITY_DN9967_c2_g1~~TRINITY_DN9967_c2_g1_i1.p1  ORF type:complete len:582 (+),score=123.46 TRINITY_DN9967_c2_g1_i1:121-1866(+)